MTVTYCPTCARMDGAKSGAEGSTTKFCDELCELRAHMSMGDALKVQALRRNTEATLLLVATLQAKEQG